MFSVFNFSKSSWPFSSVVGWLSFALRPGECADLCCNAVERFKSWQSIPGVAFGIFFFAPPCSPRPPSNVGAIDDGLLNWFVSNARVFGGLLNKLGVWFWAAGAPDARLDGVDTFSPFDTFGDILYWLADDSSIAFCAAGLVGFSASSFKLPNGTVCCCVGCELVVAPPVVSSLWRGRVVGGDLSSPGDVLAFDWKLRFDGVGFGEFGESACDGCFLKNASILWVLTGILLVFFCLASKRKRLLTSKRKMHLVSVEHFHFPIANESSC